MNETKDYHPLAPVLKFNVSKQIMSSMRGTKRDPFRHGQGRTDRSGNRVFTAGQEDEKRKMTRSEAR